MKASQWIDAAAPIGEAVLWAGRPTHRFFWVSYILGVALLSFYGVGAFLIVLVLLRQWTYRFAITTKRVTGRTGIIGRTRRELLLADVRSAELHQGPVARLLGIGTIRIATAATGKVELNLWGVTRPAYVLAVLRRGIDKARRANSGAARKERS